MDRYRLREMREKLKEEAKHLGQQPSGGESPRKVTIVSFGENGQELRKIRQLWRTYAVDLFTLAGCDYQLLEINAQLLDKALDNLLPVADGEIPTTDKPVPRVITAENWLIPTMAFWMQRLNNGTSPALDVSEWESSVDPVKAALYKLWQTSRPEPRASIAFDEGIISLTTAGYAALKEGTKVLGTRPSIIPKLGYIPCDPSLRWYHSIIKVSGFSQASLCTNSLFKIVFPQVASSRVHRECCPHDSS